MVNLKVFHPQELEVFVILPAIRREISKRMKNKGVPQKEIAHRLGVTPAAISQYLAHKRGSPSVEFPLSMKPAFDQAVESIHDEHSLRQASQGLLRLAMMDQVTCGVHKKMNGDIPKDCVVCFEGNTGTHQDRSGV